jgi:hypothetical protein
LVGAVNKDRLLGWVNQLSHLHAVIQTVKNIFGDFGNKDEGRKSKVSQTLNLSKFPDFLPFIPHFVPPPGIEVYSFCAG